MNVSQKTFLKLLKQKNNSSETSDLYKLEKCESEYLSPLEMANLYIDSALLVTIADFLKEQLWLTNKQDKLSGKSRSYEEFLRPFFTNELLSIFFLEEFLISNGADELKNIRKETQLIEHQVLKLISSRSSLAQKEFVTHSLKEMTKKFILEENNQLGVDQSLGHQGPDLYRTFDNLDDIFELNYQLDRDMTIDFDAKERLYEGAGVGVQSGYSTILLALEGINAKRGSKIVDLGSGYGRVGLVCALLRPDLDFTGYEYVPHRVVVSNKACDFLDLGDSLNFEVQDLSLASFKIPIADIYYLYDPFTKETYRYVLEQIVEISKTQQVTIVTKGNGRAWLLDICRQNSWPTPIFIDEGNLCIFKSC